MGKEETAHLTRVGADVSNVEGTIAEKRVVLLLAPPEFWRATVHVWIR